MAGGGDARVDDGAVEFHVVGDALVDVLASNVSRMPSWGGDATASSIQVQPGGSALNTAVHLASALGAGAASAVSFHGCVGEDANARVLRAHLEQACVRPRLAVLPELPTGCSIVLSGSTERAFVTSMGAAGALSAAHVAGPLLEAVRAAARCPPGGGRSRRIHVHFGGLYSYGPLRWEIPGLVADLRREAGAALELTVSADAQGFEDEHLQGLPAALACLDLIKCNAQEAAALLRLQSEAAADVAPSPAAMARALAGGRRSAVVTCGERGACFCRPGDAGEEGDAPAYAVEVADSTGAGDAFCAALLATWVLGAPLAAAARAGCAAGAACCRLQGGCVEAVSKEEIEAVMRAAPSCCEG